MFKYLIICTSFVLFLSSCRDEAYHNEISTFQFELNREFANAATSPLLPEDLQQFVKLPFFEVQKKYRVKAELTRTPFEPSFEMVTTTERRPIYKKFGIAKFQLNGAIYTLSIFQNQEILKDPTKKKYLFLPFGDLTNGVESYGGGRFIDLEIPEGNQLIIDFNKSYNPLCAYNHAFSCPIPPAENRLNLPIYAGVKAPSSKSNSAKH